MTDINDVGVCPFREGQTESMAHRVTADEVARYATLSGDANPLHVDADFARRQGHKAVVAHGMLTASLVSRVIGTRLPGDGALWTSQEFEFSGAVYPEDTLTAVVEVKSVIERERLLVLSAVVRNQHGHVVLRGLGRVHYQQSSVMKAASTNSAVRSAIVLGASGSLGYEICRSILAAGIDCLAVFHNRPDSLESLRAQADLEPESGHLRLVQADLTREASRRKLQSSITESETWPSIVIAAASAPPESVPVEDLTGEDITRAIARDIVPLSDLVSTLVPRMKSEGFGRIISLGSTAAVNRPDAGWAAYAVAKAAIAAYIKSLALEVGPFGVTCNSIAPGLTASGMTALAPGRVKAVATGETPTRRLTTPRDVAAVVTFLVSDAAKNINGQQIVVDGGREMPW